MVPILRWRWPAESGPQWPDESFGMELSGCGDPLTIHQLKELSKLYSPGVFFLSETKNSAKKLRNIQKNLRMDQSCIVDPIGTAGGLALFWQNEIQLSIIYTTNFFIEA